MKIAQIVTTAHKAIDLLPPIMRGTAMQELEYKVTEVSAAKHSLQRYVQELVNRIPKKT